MAEGPQGWSEGEAAKLYQQNGMEEREIEESSFHQHLLTNIGEYASGGGRTEGLG